jgi:acetylornithine/N-succinyldiaminopimelate aminotransferase
LIIKKGLTIMYSIKQVENINTSQEKDREYVANTYQRFDVCLVRGKNATVISDEGKEYIDFTSGIGVNSLGFCDDLWIKAITHQLGMMQHCSNLYYSKPSSDLAQELVRRSGLKKVVFLNSGAEANECAIKISRKYGNKSGGRNEIITLEGSFHGRTMAALTATGQPAYHKNFQPFLEGFSYGSLDIEHIKSLISDKTCGILIELIQGEGGVRVLPKTFVKEVEQLCRHHDLLFMVDEVQTGIGRTGTLFAYQGYGFQPDIVTFAKGIGGGLPLGGVLLGEKVKDVLEPGDHGSTFGANPVVCQGALAVLDRLTPEFLKQVVDKGRIITEELGAMTSVKNLDGRGLMIGFQVEGKEPKDIVKMALAQRLLVLTANDKVRILPPLTISIEEIGKGLDILKIIIG